MCNSILVDILLQEIAWRQGGAPTYSVPAAVFGIFTVLTFEDDPQITARSKICVDDDPQTSYPFQIAFWGWSSNYCAFQTAFRGWSSKYYTFRHLFRGDPRKYCTFKTLISRKKTLRKCSEFRTKYGTNLACILVYFSYAFFIRVKSRFLS